MQKPPPVILAVFFAFFPDAHGQEVRIDTSQPVNAVRIGDRVSIYRPSASRGKLLLTSARRDLHGKIDIQGLELVVPKLEEQFFTKPELFWEMFWESRFHDYDARQSRWLVRGVSAAKITPVAGGGQVPLGDGGNIDVIDTPGFTRGSITYMVTLQGKKYAFAGDLIYEGGRIWDLYSLQDAIPDAVTSTRVAGRNTVRGYHGFAARASDLMQSLAKVRDAKPDLIVPARGPVIRNPEQAIGQLLNRLQALMREHFSTDALRWYWGDDNLRTRAGKMSVADVKWMEMAETRKLPDWVIPIQNSKLILSRSGGAYLVDCGYERVYEEVEKLRHQGRFHKLEGIYVTHYHDDHTDFVAEASKRSGAPVIYSEKLRDVLEKPDAYRLPAMTRNPISGQALAEGAKRTWHEFEMEFAFFPGQTLYHGVMVLTHRDSGMRIVFGGDSFTPSGMDDYCLLNRNLIGENEGYLYCLRYLRKLGNGVFLTNQHVEPMWTYSTSQIDRMEESLRKRAVILRELFPWDSPNYGVDEQWVRFYPYGVVAAAGTTVDLEVRVTNHSKTRRRFYVQPNLPEGWKASPAGAISVEIDPSRDGIAKFRAEVPASAVSRSLNVVTADVTSIGMAFPGFVEAMVRIH